MADKFPATNNLYQNGAARRATGFGLDRAVTRRGFVSMAGLMAVASLAGCGSGQSSSGDASGSAATSGSSSSSSKKANDQGYILVEQGKLIGVSDMAYPPMESIPDGSTDPEGFEIDLMDAVAKKLGLEMKWLPATKFDTIIPLIKQGGRADVGVSSFTITDERKKEIDFTDSYLDSNQGLVTKKGASATTEDALNVEGTQVAVQSGTTGEQWVEENLPKATCVPLDDAIQAMTGVSTGLYTACVADLPVVTYLCTKSYTDLQVSIQIPTGEQYGIVVSKDNAKLTEDINTALSQLKDDGTIDQLEKKWFGDVLS